jgi:hypothetical protein
MKHVECVMKHARAGWDEIYKLIATEATYLANWVLSALTCLLAASARPGSKVAGPAITC